MNGTQRPNPGALPWARGGVPFVVRDADRGMIGTFTVPELAELAVVSVNTCASARQILTAWKASAEAPYVFPIDPPLDHSGTLQRLYELLVQPGPDRA